MPEEELFNLHITKEVSIMDPALQKIIDERVLLPEALAELNKTITQVREILEELKAGLPPALEAFIQLIEISPVMNDDTYDELRVTVNFYSSSGSNETMLLLQGGFSFTVKCIDPNLEDTVEEAFYDNMLNYVRTSKQYLTEITSLLENSERVLHVLQ